jgi:phosphatidylglycerophosphate synthase
MRSLRGFFTWLFTPAARRLVRVSPNALTGVSVAAGVAAGVMFWMAGGRPACYAAAALLMAISGTADALDGLVARLSGRVSKLGELLDHFGDRLIEVGILAGIAGIPGAHLPLGVVVIVLTLLHSYLGTQIEATFGVRDYSGPGKAEQFVVLILFSTVLAVASAPGGWPALAAWLPDAFLLLLGAGTVAGLIHRVRQAWMLGRAEGGGASGGIDDRWKPAR